MPPFAMKLSKRAEHCARKLDALPDYKVLRRLPRPTEVWCRSMPSPEPFSSTRVAVVDTETTGLDPSRHRIIELAVVKMTICDVRGDLLDIAPPRTWLEDPGTPLLPEIETLTGLTDTDLAGQKFDDDTIADAFDDIDVIVAANARFDAGFMRQRFPQLGHPWACSLSEIDWAGHGFHDGRSVGSLVTTAGFFFEDAHRAGPDAWAVAVLLAMTAGDGKTIASHLLSKARRPTYRLYASGAPFSVKDSLKAVGYRWCAEQKAWWIEADPERIDNERAWLISLCPAILPRSERIDWYSRHAS